ncbi:RNA 2',3'-cyclic phosphodiesterase [Mesobacillus maritimus]|uniref:RNA 2',3'-cyclic phosphodiesterase n=1 Tax=Mesobacillus maritimus TaxID=1643336 RepID=UPI00384B2E72
MSQSSQHYFYALELPNETKERLGKHCRDIQETLPFKRWVHTQDYHITLAFLGNAPDKMLTESIKKLESGIDCPVFSLKIKHLGVFGKSDSPRIFWAGVNQQPFLEDAREIVYQACIESGFKLETRPFKPHITLARKWAGENLFTNQLLQKADPFLIKELEFDANKIVLYKTHLGKEPKYEAVLKIPLQS